MNFDLVAPWFERLEKLMFRDQMQSCRTAFLSDLPAIKKAALIGEGNGSFLEDFLLHCDCGEVHYIDSSNKMLALSQKRLQKHSDTRQANIKYFCRDLRFDMMPDQNYDLVVTNFFLDVFNADTLHKVISEISAACTENARWLYADFQVTGNRLQQWRSMAWVKTMYLFFKVAAGIQTMRLTDPSSFLDSYGFEVVSVTDFGNELMRAELRQRII